MKWSTKYFLIHKIQTSERLAMKLSTAKRFLTLTACAIASVIAWLAYIETHVAPNYSEPSLYSPHLPMPLQPRHRNSLVFSAGFGTTATHAVFKATCQLGLRSLHYEKQCGWWKSRRFDSKNPELPPPAVLAHERLLRAHRALKDCVAQAANTGPCPTVREAIDGMRRHIDQVLYSASDVALHDTPYPEFAEYVIQAAQRIRGVEPVLLLSERDPNIWAQKRVSHSDDLICKLSSNNHNHDKYHSSEFKYLGQNIYWCLQSAIENNMADSSIREALWVVHQLDSRPEKRAQMLEEGYTLYRNVMREKIAAYQVDLFQRNNVTSQNVLATEIKAALDKQITLTAQSKGQIRNAVRRTPDFNTIKGCMSDYRVVFSSGRFCDKLVLFLHFHKAGGSSIIEHFIDRGLWYDLGINIDAVKHGLLREGHDVTFGGYGRNNLRIHSAANQTRVSSINFWDSVYNRGIDVVNLEYNFITPSVYFDLQSAFWKVTQLREPWGRYRSTYERELYIRCGRTNKECFQSNSLHSWMTNHKGVMTGKREEKWVCTLCPNYYTRMLNGMGDHPKDALITRDHLLKAKAILDTFDVVMILEDSDDVNLGKLIQLFGTMNEEMPSIPPESNNKLKKDSPIYQFVRKEMTDPLRERFREQNQLDIELYEYARERFG